MFQVNNKISTLTPEGIYPLIKNDAFFASRNPKIIENTLLFCTLLYLHYFYYKDKNGENKNDEENPFQGISSDLLIKILSRDNYKDILQRLEHLQIIEINNSYLAGYLPKSYRLNDKFTKQKPIVRKLRYASIEKKFEKYIKSNQTENFKTKDCPYLMKQKENLKLIHIDTDSALNWIEENKGNVDFSGEKIIKGEDRYIKQVYSINNGFGCRISVSDSNNRVHSSMTSFPKKLRRFLFLMDEKTGEMKYDKVIIDGNNTQPLLICIKMKQEGFEPDKDFFKYCLEGTLYQQLAEELCESRNWVKNYMMEAILFTYGNCRKVQRLKNPIGNDIDKQKIARYFKSRFPAVYYWLLNKKETLRASKLKTKNYLNKGGSLLAYEIQRMEAELWIHKLLPEIPEDIIYATIHDSIMLFAPQSEQIELVKQLIIETGRNLYGIDIPIKIEYLKN